MAIEAFHRVTTYAERLWLVQASSAHTALADLERMVADRPGTAALFVDYLQKIAVYPEPATEADRVIRIAEGLKELALTNDVAVVAVAAADHHGLVARRMRLHHLRGSVALAYEADVAIMLNEKATAVSKIHLAYDPMGSEKFRRQVVFTVEKNRGGPAHTDLDFEKDFPNFRFDPHGGFVSEKLIDDIVYEE
jgi:replicative DNA helicase